MVKFIILRSGDTVKKENPLENCCNLRPYLKYKEKPLPAPNRIPSPKDKTTGISKDSRLLFKLC